MSANIFWKTVKPTGKWGFHLRPRDHQGRYDEKNNRQHTIKYTVFCQYSQSSVFTRWQRFSHRSVAQFYFWDSVLGWWDLGCRVEKTKHFFFTLCWGPRRLYLSTSGQPIKCLLAFVTKYFPPVLFTCTRLLTDLPHWVGKELSSN